MQPVAIRMYMVGEGAGSLLIAAIRADAGHGDGQVCATINRFILYIIMVNIIR